MSYAPYSYSKLATYKKCPAQFKYSYIDRIKIAKSESPQMQRGTAIHDSIENYVLGAAPELHPEIHENYGQFVHGLREGYQCFPEQGFGLKADLTVCAYDDPEVWFRGYFDLKILPKEGTEGFPIIYEWKTGGIYEEEHAAQRMKYGTVALLQHPEYERVQIITVYLDHQKFRVVDYYQMMINEYRLDLQREVRELEADRIFITKPQFMCRYCQFSRAATNNPEAPCPF